MNTHKMFGRLDLGRLEPILLAAVEKLTADDLAERRVAIEEGRVEPIDFVFDPVSFAADAIFGGRFLCRIYPSDLYDRSTSPLN